MHELPENCLIPNPYLKKQVIPDVLDATEIIQEGEPGASDLLPELTGAIDVLVSLSGLNPTEALKDQERLKRGLGCISCEFIDVCPLPRALEGAAKIAEGSMHLNGLVKASESGNMLAKAWLSGRMNAFTEEDAEVKDPIMVLTDELTEKLVEAKTINDLNVLVIQQPQNNGVSSQPVYIVDTEGKVSRVLSGHGKVAISTGEELYRIIESIQSIGINETVASRFKTAAGKNQKTADKKPIYKSTQNTPGGYRLILGIGSDTNGSTWLLLSDAVDHDEQDRVLRDGAIRKLHVGDTIAAFVPPKNSDKN